MLRIVWHGHSCFEFRDEGRSLVIDPHDGHSIGVPPPTARADVVAVTHSHFDHSAVRVVEKAGTLTRTVALSEQRADLPPFRIRRHPAWHDGENGRTRGPVSLTEVEAGGLRLLHLSDLGHALDEAFVARLSRPDICFVPAGGVFTLPAREAWETIDRLAPRVVVPMHYKTPGLALPLMELEVFLGGRPTVVVGQSVEVGPEDLPSETEVWEFDR